MKTQIAPSILPLKMEQLPSMLFVLEQESIDWIHVDIMDGKFVENETSNFDLVKLTNESTHLPLDVHLMVEEPYNDLEKYVELGADLITVHIEAIADFQKYINKLKQLKCKVGISLKPDTKVEELEPFLTQVDLVLVMSVEPGKGGQSFMPEMLEKVRFLRDYKANNKTANYIIEIDGGINDETSNLAAEAGAELLVAGSFIFKDEIAKQVDLLKHEVK